jgi:hypothetical protein
VDISWVPLRIGLFCQGAGCHFDSSISQIHSGGINQAKDLRTFNLLRMEDHANMVLSCMNIARLYHLWPLCVRSKMLSQISISFLIKDVRRQ